jgi:sporulation protein YlmC with PRC-barrel domain
MRTLMIVSGALAAAMVSGTAMADQHGMVPKATDPATTTITTVPPDQQAAAPASGFELIGKDVIGQRGDDVGQIDNVLVDAQGQPSHVVLAHGGWLGLGEKKVALGFDQIQVSREEVRVNLTDEQLANMPEYQRAADLEGGDPADRPQSSQAPASSPDLPQEQDPHTTVPGAPGVGDQPLPPRAIE